MGKIGNGLKSAMKAYDDAVGSLDRRVLPAARRMQELGLKDKKKIEAPQTLLPPSEALPEIGKETSEPPKAET